MNGEEKRQFPREQAAFALTYKVRAPLSVRSEFGEAERDAIASDLSERGLRIFTDFDLPIGAILTLKFRLISTVGNSPDERVRRLELQAEVRHSKPAPAHKASFLVGLHFMGLSEVDRHFIAGALRGS
jgi:hypothetical protein